MTFHFKQIRRIAFATLVVGSAFTGCRTPRRADQVTGDTAKLFVSLIGMETTSAESNAQSPVAFELSGCTETTVGSLQADGTVLFKSGKFIRSQICDLKVRALYSSADTRYIGEPGTLYWAKSVKIGEDKTGQFIATANLQPMFERLIPRQPGRTFTIQIPVIFTPAPNDAPISASLDCNPRIANVAEYSDASGAANKTFTFVAEARADTKYTCKFLWVSAGGIGQKYQGRVTEQTFDGYADAQVKLNPVELILVPRNESGLGSDAAGGDVNVTTSPGSCANGEVFNIVTRLCEKS